MLSWARTASYESAGRKRVGRHMDLIFQALCFCFVASSSPVPQVAQRTGDIWYTHETLRGKHLLRLSTTDFIVDSNDQRRDRLAEFANRFAGDTCQGPYKLTNAVRASWPKIGTTYAMQFIFRCA